MLKRVLPFVFCLCVSLLSAAPALAGGFGFGLQSFEMSAVKADGSPDLQAGSDPYALTTSFLLNESEELTETASPRSFLPAGGGPRIVRVELPPGFVGNPNAVPKCPYPEFIVQECPNDTALGVVTTDTASSGGYVSPITGEYIDRILYATNPLYNVEAPAGVAAEFGFVAQKTAPILIDASVRTGSDYGITTNSRVPQAVVVQGAKVTIWGVPANPAHDHIRGTCLGEDLSYNLEGEEGHPHQEEESVREEEEAGGVQNPVSPAGCPANIPVKPFLTNPTSCGQPRSATLSVDSWEQPSEFDSKTVTLPPLQGCEHLAFSPTLTVTPDAGAGSTPTGLNVDVHVPQESTGNPEGLGEADVRDTTVVLPAGMQLSPSAADGLQGCSLAQIALNSPGKPSCPDASKVANVRIDTPLLEGELTGAVYLAAPQNFTFEGAAEENPFRSLIAMYLVAEEPATGVLVKLPGRVSLSETGQITTTFENTPQLPFSDLKLEFYGTDRAPLATPALCGSYTTTSSFTPWSAPQSGAARTPSSTFQITSGPNGSPCADPLPFSPSLASGTTNVNAGGFSPLTTTLSREDGQQQIQQVTLHYPGGVTGILAGVPLCGEAQANAGTCGEESKIGEAIVSVGLGSDPFSVTNCKVYLTVGYKGAPFGLSVVAPAKAGPFVLQEGRPVVVRAKIEVDPTTAALTVTTDSSGEHAIPSIIEGIPLQIKRVNVLVNRPGFTVNPTSCNPTSITGTVASAEGASSPVSVPFQVTNCQALKYEPKLTVTTAGNASKAGGASLSFKIAYPKGAIGHQAWFNEAKFDIPKQLPARLTTIQQACLAATFEHERSKCPAHSIIGHAVVHTPVLPVPLEGPVYFVSYGGAAFPDAVMVLDGYGVHIELHGNTFINSKTGVTSATFKNTPDVPFESIEVTLPTGPYSEFGTNLGGSYDFCGQKLTMPTELKAQNGAEIKQNTPVTVTGCPKVHKAKKRKSKHRKKHHGKGKRK